MPIKMIVTDLDNTLLRTDKTVSSYSLSVFIRLREKGIMTAFATARYFRTVEEWLIPAIGFRPDIVISLNGVYAYREGQTLYRSVIPPDIGNTLVSAVRKAGGKVTVGTDTVRYCERGIDETHKNFSVACDFGSTINEDFHYIDLRGADFAVIDEIVHGFPSVRIQRYADTELMSIQNKNARKELALTAVIRMLDVSAKDVTVFGDDHNDVEMLRMCGTSVAVGNAIDEVKAVAAYVCDTNNNDGVAKWIEENVLLE